LLDGKSYIPLNFIVFITLQLYGKIERGWPPHPDWDSLTEIEAFIDSFQSDWRASPEFLAANRIVIRHPIRYFYPRSRGSSGRTEPLSFGDVPVVRAGGSDFGEEGGGSLGLDERRVCLMSVIDKDDLTRPLGRDGFPCYTFVVLADDIESLRVEDVISSKLESSLIPLLRYLESMGIIVTYVCKKWEQTMSSLDDVLSIKVSQRYCILHENQLML
jgi:hypothetical protein